MHDPETAKQERRAGSQHLIRDLVHLRTAMLALYAKLAARKPFVSDDDISELLREFCEILIDYTANAHFRLYRFLDEKSEKRRAVLDLAHRIYPRIVESTQYIVDFNDRYDAPADEAPSIRLEKDLSSLGEELAERIELEDRLIEVLCKPRGNRLDGQRAPT